MPRYITQEKAHEFPALSGLTAEQIQKLVDFAHQVYKFVDEHQFSEKAEIRVWAESIGVSQPEAVTRALSLLRETGRLISIGQIAPAVIANGAALVLAKLSLEQLQEMASIAEIPGRSTMTKAELVQALALFYSTP